MASRPGREIAAETEVSLRHIALDDLSAKSTDLDGLIHASRREYIHAPLCRRSIPIRCPILARAASADFGSSPRHRRHEMAVRLDRL